MKKILFLLVAIATMVSIIGCSDDVMKVNIEEDNSASQWNYELEGKTLTFSEPSSDTLTKTVQTTSGTSTTTTTETIALSTDTYTIVFGELTDEAGTVTITYTRVANANADAAYADSVSGNTTTTYSGADFDNAGYSGVTMISQTTTGTYQKKEDSEGVNFYVVVPASGTQVVDNTTGSTTLPRDGSTYTSTGTTTNNKSFDADTLETFAPVEDGASNNYGRQFWVVEEEDGSEKMLFETFSYGGGTWSSGSYELYTVSEPE